MEVSPRLENYILIKLLNLKSDQELKPRSDRDTNPYRQRIDCYKPSGGKRNKLENGFASIEELCQYTCLKMELVESYYWIEIMF